MKHPWILGGVLLLAGCGQTGALYLPEGATESPILIRPMTDAPEAAMSPASVPGSAPSPTAATQTSVPGSRPPPPGTTPTPVTRSTAPAPPGEEPTATDREQQPAGVQAPQPDR